MILLLKIYMVGVVVSALLLIMLAIYEKRKGEDVSEFPASIILTFFSWITVLGLLYAYRDQFKNMFKKQKKNEK